MHRLEDADLRCELPANADALVQDLELDTLFAAMAGNDPFLFEVSRRAVLRGLDDPAAIVYRQEVLADCLQSPSVTRDLYRLAVQATQAEKSVWGSLLRDSPSSMLRTAVQKMEVLVDYLRRLRDIADRHAAMFRSDGFTRFFAMVEEELDPPYFEVVEACLQELTFHGGLLLSAALATGNKGAGYALRRPRERGWLGRVIDRSGYTFTVPERDQGGFRALAQLEDRGVNSVANALLQSVDHVRSFFARLQMEVGFYVACVNLRERLADKQEPTCFPAVAGRGEFALSGRGVYDPCLALTIERRVVGNELNADGKSLIMITGANQGGKSTFLRSVGLAQLMMQCGMFVAAESLRANVCEGLFTHFAREEDEMMESGKLDDELARMSGIVDHLTSNSMLLCNESFGATNEREGSEIARQAIWALVEAGVKVLFVTHLYELASGLYEQHLDGDLFLRAERTPDSDRTFRVIAGEPLATSYGADSYRRIFKRELDGRCRASVADAANQRPHRQRSDRRSEA